MIQLYNLQKIKKRENYFMVILLQIAVGHQQTFPFGCFVPTERHTLYVPGLNVFKGFCTEDLVPSPKFHLHTFTLQGVLSVNFTVLPGFAGNVKFGAHLQDVHGVTVFAHDPPEQVFVHVEHVAAPTEETKTVRIRKNASILNSGLIIINYTS
jgi:hypothetical protein